MALIKREILTSRKVLSTKSCTRNQFLFCKKMLSKIRMFQPTKEWVNKVKLSSFELENFFKFVLAWLAREKQNILTPQPCLHTLMQTLLSANQSARTILVIL